MNDLLYLVHRIPYPPNKGDKIRSYNILKKLAENYRVYLGTFVDNKSDWQYCEQVKHHCVDTLFLPLNPTTAKLRSLTGLFNGSSLTMPYYQNTVMQAWVDRIIEKTSLQRALIFSSSMGQYIAGEKYQSLKKVMDFVDMDSDKWRQYSQKKSWPMNWVYRRESVKLNSVENRFAQQFDRSVFVSQSEADLFRSQLSTNQDRVSAINNGVDSDYFSPQQTLPNPYPERKKVIVFTGAMDYWANVESVYWFADHVFPQIRLSHPDACFYIVGSNPAREVLALSEREGIKVTGSVPDIRPYIMYASVAVAPLRIARGVQNKVLEAMAMGKTILSSPAALEGIDYAPVMDKLLCNDENDFVKKCTEYLTDGTGDDSAELRQHVVNRYNWNTNLHTLFDLIESA